MEKSPPKPLESISGLVEPGDGRGAKLGFPTANLKLDNHQERPSKGIYACYAQINDEKVRYKAALHSGPRPTFSGAASSIEVHLIHFPYRTLYGEKITCTGLVFIRDIKKFTSVKMLLEAITNDIYQAERLLV